MIVLRVPLSPSRAWLLAGTFPFDISSPVSNEAARPRNSHLPIVFSARECPDTGRSSPGRPAAPREARDLIQRVSAAPSIKGQMPGSSRK